MWRGSSANLDLFPGSQAASASLFITHSGVPFKPCSYFVCRRFRLSHEAQLLRRRRGVRWARSVRPARRKFVRCVARQLIGSQRFAGLVHRRRHLGPRLSRRIFSRRLGWLTRCGRRNLGRLDGHLHDDLAIVAELRTALRRSRHRVSCHCWWLGSWFGSWLASLRCLAHGAITARMPQSSNSSESNSSEPAPALERAQAGEWQTASMLWPSGSSTKAP